MRRKTNTAITPFRRGLKVLIRIIKTILLVLLMILIGFLLFLTITEYRPQARELVTVEGDRTEGVTRGTRLRFLTWNIGYGAQGSNTAFYKGGGLKLRASTKQRVRENLDAIAEKLKSEQADYIFLQEVDRDSSRSYHLDEKEILQAPEMDSAFAWNYRVLYVPYPVPPKGEVNAGLMIQSSCMLTKAERIRLTCPFSWPQRLGSLKRCLLVSRTPVVDENGDDTGKELVCVNLHLEAYDSGEGKKAQAAELRSLIEEEAEKGNYVIAGGDFNQTFSNTDSSMYPHIRGTWKPGVIDTGEFGDGWQFEMDNSYPTCRSLETEYEGADTETFQYYLIDGFIVSDNIQVENVKTENLRFVNSDHDPVIMTVTLK